eukprot:COSAG02_NODE_2584_length_8477_cov_16.463714_1_plen_77_part_00
MPSARPAPKPSTSARARYARDHPTAIDSAQPATRARTTADLSLVRVRARELHRPRRHCIGIWVFLTRLFVSLIITE